MLILVDQDGVLADFEHAFLQRFQKANPNGFFIPLEDRKIFHVQEEYPENLFPAVEAIYHEPGFFANLPLIPGAKEGFFALLEMGHTVRICTSPLHIYGNCVNEKYEWVERYLGFEFTKLMILTKDKTLVKGDILIDDRPEIPGVCIPEWEHVIFDAPYNRHIKNRRRITWGNWQSLF